MKTTLYILGVSTLLFACNAPKEEQPLAQEKPIKFTKATEDILFPTLALESNKKAVAEYKKTGDASILPERYKLAMEDLRSVYQFIPVHKKGIARASDLRQAMKGYQKFVSNHQKDTLRASEFRNNFSSKLLRNAEWVATSSTEELTFSTNELIKSQMGNYELIIKGLTKLKGQITEKEFDQMIFETQTQIEKSIPLEKLVEQSAIEEIQKRELDEKKEKQESARLGVRPKPRKRIMIAMLKNILNEKRGELLEEYLIQIKNLKKPSKTSKTTATS